MINIENKVNAIRKRAEKVKSWKNRIARLSMSEAQFCQKHDILYTKFNSIKNFNINYLPSERYVNKIESALKSEGV